MDHVKHRSIGNLGRHARDMSYLRVHEVSSYKTSYLGSYVRIDMYMD